MAEYTLVLTQEEIEAVRSMVNYLLYLGYSMPTEEELLFISVSDKVDIAMGIV